ncbi:hypothetical protein KGF56_000726 [Candida oxycetoniae]|uniref:2-dehydropantolactone reductase n=1 Tax=Candida oxycetoniae TaxID=497107 RepID=A0AAI9X001_9ASCO|nr:uncharacterized protein KGF56_000726 [Candida oxycetoniae]KAI3406594.1 hypothetical protein KGF56_000726 [Candida oxycetoniae]
MSSTHPVTFSKTFKTKSGKDITIGLGTGTKWKKSHSDFEINKELVDQLLLSLDLGFRHIDTAEVYNTQREVGEALRRTSIPREDLWITTKYNGGWGKIKGSDSPEKSIDKALKELGVDYIDLYLIHSPFFTKDVSNGFSLEDVWKVLIEAKKQGKVREIGISNAAKPHLERLHAISPSSEYFPVVNQIEFHPFLQNQSRNIVQYCQEHGILVEAFSPLAPLARVENNALGDLLKKLSQTHLKTDAQILLRYTLQKGILPITTSSKESRIRESLDLFDFELSRSEVEEIDKIGQENPYRAFFHEQFKDL